jgi:two-component system, OmpR family, alkaline phosphatase synthesis response regulator PhoP
MLNFTINNFSFFLKIELTMSKILIIDDEEDIREVLKYNFEKEGFSVDVASSGEEGLSKIKIDAPDLIILDLMMPGMDGIEVIEIIRATPALSNIIVCMLTARNEDYSQIAGLDSGADDYVSKPIKPKVLISRVNALLRRKGVIESELETSITDLIINRDKYIVERNGEVIHLPRKEFELLALLASKPRKVFERNHILEHVWGAEVVVGDRTIDVHVRKLREKLGENYITTVKGVGYKFSNPD